MTVDELVAGFVPTNLEVKRDNRKHTVVEMSQFLKTLIRSVEPSPVTFTEKNQLLGT